MKINILKIIFIKLLFNIKMNKKDLVITKLEDLKKIYLQQEDKKWNARALSIAINALKKYDNTIENGNQLKKELKGIGDKIAMKIDEILETGTLKELENVILSNNSIENLLLITGVGLVRAKKWIVLGINNIENVKEAIKNGLITTTHHIDLGIKYYDDFQKRIPKDEIDKIKIFLNNQISKIDKKLIFEICGSYRRGASDSGDIDILISHIDYVENISEQKFLQKIVKELTKNNFIIDSLTSKGNTKFMGVCRLEGYQIARRIDIRLVDYQSYYTSIIYFTGSKNFNVLLRNKALELKYSLNEYALTNLENNSLQLLNSEKEIFEILKIPYLNPNERNI